MLLLTLVQQAPGCPCLPRWGRFCAGFPELFFFAGTLSRRDNAFSASGIFMTGLSYIPLLLLPATYLATSKLVFVAGGGGDFRYRRLFCRHALRTPQAVAQGFRRTKLGGRGGQPRGLRSVLRNLRANLRAGRLVLPLRSWGLRSMPSPSWATF